MPSNLLKSGYVTYHSEEKRIIDTSELLARKMEQEKFLAANSFEEEVESTAVYREVQTEEGVEDLLTEPSEERLLAEKREEMLQQAQEEIAQMKRDAAQELEKCKAIELESARAEGKKAGYEAGFQEGTAAAEKIQRQLEQKEEQLVRSYEEKIAELEPLFVKQMTDIYEHVFQVSFRDDVDVIFHLIDVALHGIDSGKDFIIKTSKDDYPFICMQKKKLIASIADASIEVVEDTTLEKGQCLIETGGGVFDCSVDVELKELGKRLRLLSWQSEEVR